MPVYSYLCEECGEFDLLRPMDLRNAPAACPSCACSSQRMIQAPNLALMAPGLRRAHSINDRSRHEPRVSQNRQTDPACGCHSPLNKNRRVQSTKLGQLEAGRRSSRPWMLGH